MAAPPLLNFGDRQIMQSDWGEFGHYTNNIYRLRKLYMAKPNNNYGLTTPKEDIFVFSQFFNLYHQDNDNDASPAGFGAKVTSADGVPINIEPHRGNPGQFEIIHSDPNIPAARRVDIQAIGLQMILLGEENVGGLRQDDVRRPYFRTQIENNLNGYLQQQLLAMWIANQYNFDYGFRVYFDNKSLQLWQNIRNEISLEIKFPDAFNTVINRQNLALQRNWDFFCTYVQTHQRRFRDIHITVEVKDNFALSLNVLGIDGLPQTTNLKTLKFTFLREATVNERRCGLYLIYSLFPAPNEALYNTINSKLEFFSYVFNQDTPYVETYTFKIRVGGVEQNVPGSYHRRNGFIGQLFRYVALSQTSYGGINSPKKIHYRDAHQMMLTSFEIARLEMFYASGKRCLWGVGKDNNQAWARTNVQYLPYTAAGLADRNAGRFPPGTAPTAAQTTVSMVNGLNVDIPNTSSVYPGLCSFQKLADAENCVFGTQLKFKQTIGLFLRGNIPGLSPYINDAICGIRTGRLDGPPNFFSYGCDARVLTHCFYSILFTPVAADGNYYLDNDGNPVLEYVVRQGFPNDDDYSRQLRLDPSAPLPAELFNRIPQLEIIRDSLWYSVDIQPNDAEVNGNNTPDVKSVFWNTDMAERGDDLLIPRNFNAETLCINGDTLIDRFALIYPTIPPQVRKIITACLTNYIAKYGRMPRNYYQLVKSIEDLRNIRNDVNGSGFITSVYHKLTLLGRNNNNQDKPFLFNTLWKPVVPKVLEKLYTIGTNPLYNPPPPNECTQVHFNTNITSYNKGLLARTIAAANGVEPGVFCQQVRRRGVPEPTKYCWGDYQNSSVYDLDDPLRRNPGNSCASQPSDVRYTPAATLFKTRAQIGGQYGGSPNTNRKNNGNDKKIEINNRQQNTYPNNRVNTATRISPMDKKVCEIMYNYFIHKSISDEDIELLRTYLTELSTDIDRCYITMRAFKALYPSTKSQRDASTVMVDWYIPTDFNLCQYNEFKTFLDQFQGYMTNYNNSNPMMFVDVYFKKTTEPVYSIQDIQDMCYEETIKNMDKMPFLKTNSNATTRNIVNSGTTTLNILPSINSTGRRTNRTPTANPNGNSFSNRISYVGLQGSSNATPRRSPNQTYRVRNNQRNISTTPLQPNNKNTRKLRLGKNNSARFTQNRKNRPLNMVGVEAY
jgi:hypothetical protein